MPSQEAVELAWTANAYVDASIDLCDKLMEDEDDQNIYSNRVVLHLVFLGLELCYKAGIESFSNKKPKGHELKLLRDEYDSYAPHIVSLVQQGSSEKQLTNHLEELRTLTIGVGKDRGRDKEIATRRQAYSMNDCLTSRTLALRQRLWG